MTDKYKLIGKTYDLAYRLYSGAAVDRCKHAMIRDDVISPGEKILFAGVGSGSDAILAAQLGAQVSVVDISPTMLSQLEKKLKNESEVEIECIQSDLLKLDHFGQYDTVVANFFLNIFDEDKMLTYLNHLIRLSSLEGQIIIGDYAPPQGGIINRALHNAYWYTAATSLFAWAGNAIHAIYDYQQILTEKHAMEVKEEAFFEVLGQPYFKALRAKRRD